MSKAQVNEHGMTVFHQSNVVGLDVAMKEACLMQHSQSFRALPNDPQSGEHIQSIVSSQAAPERLALEQLHDQKIGRPGDMREEKWHQMRMTDGKTGARFPLQQLDGRGLIFPIGPQQFDGTELVSSRVPG